MDVAQLRLDIAELLKPIDILRVYAFIPGSFVAPAAVIYPEGFIYHDTYDGGQNPKMIVQFLTPAVAAVSMQTQLDGWLSTGNDVSAIDALETDSRFRCEEIRNYGVVTTGGPDGPRYYSAELVVNILSD